MVFLLLPDCPLRWAQYLLTLQPVLHVWRAHLLRFLVDANLVFPQGPSARSAQLSKHSPLMHLVYRALVYMEVPHWTFKIYALGNFSAA